MVVKPILTSKTENETSKPDIISSSPSLCVSREKENYEDIQQPKVMTISEHFQSHRVNIENG